MRDRIEKRRVFWQNIGCVSQILFFPVCMVVAIATLVFIFTSNSTLSSVSCSRDTSVELRYSHDGLNWVKTLVRLTIYDNGAEPMELARAHEKQRRKFEDIQSVLFCSARGVILRGTLNNSKSSAIFEVNWEKKISIYEGYIP